MLLPATGATSPAPPGKKPSLASSSPLLADQAEMAALRKQLEEKNAVIKRLKETLSPVQKILMEMD
jgi:hypothetical protein